MNHGPEAFRQLLKSTLVDRCKKNPSYSVRAFARSLGVNHAHLSLILRGQRPVTAKFIHKTGEALGLSPKRLTRFRTLSSSAILFQGEFSMESAPFERLENDRFEVITEWYHDAILELIRLPLFKQNPRWVARRLGISIAQASVALERLVRLGLVVTNAHGQIVPDYRDTTTNGSLQNSSAALRSQQRAILEKSLEALQEYPRTVRDHSSLTLAISSKDLGKARSLIAEFRMRFMEILQQRPSDYDEVFQLSVGFFPLTKLEK
jgi:uncharacterized protein (TIGR02147 family)